MPAFAADDKPYYSNKNAAKINNTSQGNNLFPPGISYDKNLPAHLKDVVLFNQKNGIKGGHNRVNFEKELFSKGGIIKSEQPTGVDGITRITYGISKKDGSGKIMRDTAGNIMYKIPGSNPKTVYDPAKFTDKQMLDMSVNAAAKGYLKAKQVDWTQYTEDWNGIKFRVYLEPKTGEITNVHPE